MEEYRVGSYLCELSDEILGEFDKLVELTGETFDKEKDKILGFQINYLERYLESKGIPKPLSARFLHSHGHVHKGKFWYIENNHGHLVQTWIQENSNDYDLLVIGVCNVMPNFVNVNGVELTSSASTVIYPKRTYDIRDFYHCHMGDVDYFHVNKPISS